MTDADAPFDPATLAEDDEGPAFGAPWQARAFGIAMALHESDAYEWSEFQRLLIEEVDAADAEMGPAELLREAYYEQWLRALERLVEQKDLATGSELEARAAEFAAGDRDASEFVEGDR